MDGIDKAPASEKLSSQASSNWTSRFGSSLGLAAIGGAIWLVWALTFRPSWTAVLLMLSPFVLVPMGLSLVARQSTTLDAPAFDGLRLLALPAACFAAVSFGPEPGSVALALTLPWLAFATLVAALGFARLLTRRSWNEAGIGLEAGLIFMLVGAAWLVLSRGGLKPLGFSDAIVQLTAVHFHYAGFALPLVAGTVSSALKRSSLASWAVVAGVPLTALGITTGGWLEWVAATFMASVGIGTAVLLFRFSTRCEGEARSLLAVASLCLTIGMGFALGWAWSVRFDWDYLDLDGMASTHGSLNALGFGLLGLTGLTRAFERDDVNPGVERPGSDDRPTVALHLGRPGPSHLRPLAQRAQEWATTNPVGLLDRPTPAGFRRDVWTRRIDHGDLPRAAEAITRWRGHEAAGIRLEPAQPPIQQDQTLALTIPVGPISVSATCRIVDVIDEPDRFGFTYSTLPFHPSDGEESFILTKQTDDRIDLVVTAVWRPAVLASSLFPPLTRLLQRRAIGRYLDGICRAAA